MFDFLIVIVKGISTKFVSTANSYIPLNTFMSIVIDVIYVDTSEVE